MAPQADAGEKAKANHSRSDRPGVGTASARFPRGTMTRHNNDGGPR
jgi:hypothetical protein